MDSYLETPSPPFKGGWGGRNITKFAIKEPPIIARYFALRCFIMEYVFKKDNPLPPLKGGAHAAEPGKKDYEGIFWTSWDLDLGIWILEFGSWNLDLGIWVFNSGCNSGLPW
jgi:hypothetical protein